MAIYRGPGGAGDATGDATNASALALAAKNEAQASATSAASSATNAASSASLASTSASTATTKASEASTSASAASSSASSASTSASTATTKASEASTSASNASTSASTATTQASNAASSASAASTSASNASTSATNAANSATSAASSATAAAASAVTAATFDPALYLAKSGNLSGLANTSTARDNLGVEIGVDVQAFNAALAAIAANNGTNMMKNRIINGAGLINQRAVSGTVSLSAGVYGHDRFKAGASGCTYTFATSGNVTTFTITAGSLIQVVEGLNLETGTYCLSWTGTAQGKIGAGSYSASGVTGSITGGTNTNVEFNTGTLSLPQLEKGSTATSFDYRPYGTELALCQRYYYRTNSVDLFGGIAMGTVTSSTATSIYMKLSVPMRAQPTITQSSLRSFDGGTAVAVTSISTVRSNYDSIYADINNSAGLTIGRSAIIQGNNSATGYIDASSEL